MSSEGTEMRMGQDVGAGILTIGEMSPTQAARRLGLSAKRVVQMCNTGTLPCRRSPLGRLIPTEAVEALAMERDQAHLSAYVATHNSTQAGGA